MKKSPAAARGRTPRAPRPTPLASAAAATLTAAAVLPAALFAAGCGGESGATEANPAEAAAGTDPFRTAVAVAPLTPETLTDTLEISGRLEPRAEIHLAAELGGRVEEVLFDKGDSVSAGQTLARVGSDLLGAALAEAEADLAAARVEHDRARALVEREARPQQEADTAEATLNRALARVESARLRFERATIASPANGVVVRRDLEPGEVVGPGSPVATLHDTSVLVATVGIPEQDISFFAEGAPAEVILDAYGGRAVPGRIGYIAPAAERPGRNFTAEIEVPNPDRELRSGLIVRARLERRVFRDAVVVGRDLLVERDGALLAFVFRAEDGGGAIGRAEERLVTVGPDEGEGVVITSGLEIGETLIVGGHRSLLDGQPVRVAPPAGSESPAAGSESPAAGSESPAAGSESSAAGNAPSAGGPSNPAGR